MYGPVRGLVLHGPIPHGRLGLRPVVLARFYGMLHVAVRVLGESARFHWLSAALGKVRTPVPSAAEIVIFIFDHIAVVHIIVRHLLLYFNR